LVRYIRHAVSIEETQLGWADIVSIVNSTCAAGLTVKWDLDRTFPTESGGLV